MYGTEDAASMWHETWSTVLRHAGFTMGIASPALFCREGVRGLCHGDDFVVVAERSDVLAFEKILSAEFEVRRTGHLGFADDLEDYQEVEILKRTLRLHKDRNMVELEADKRHVEVLAKLYDLEKAKPTATPRIKVTEADMKRLEASEALDREEAQRFRSGTMRAVYLALDRPDISEAIKCLSSAMATPKKEHVTLLKRLIRYLRGVPRMVIKYEVRGAASRQPGAS
jgi:hypothetical protein